MGGPAGPQRRLSHLYLTYAPEGSQEPKRWRYDPRKLMSAERETLERVTDRNFAQFTTDVLQGNALCRRALLWVLLKREHPTLRFADVDFAWDEVKLEFSRQEWLLQLQRLEDSLAGPELVAARAQIEGELVDAIDEEEESGKARLPIAD